MRRGHGENGEHGGGGEQRMTRMGLWTRGERELTMARKRDEKRQMRMMCQPGMLKIAATVLGIMLLVNSCGSAAPAHDPGSVSKAFIERLYRLDFTGAEQFLTDDGLKVMRMMESYVLHFGSIEETGKFKSDAEKKQVKVVSVMEKGEQAIVTCSISIPEKSGTVILEVLKIGGRWKVNASPVSAGSRFNGFNIPFWTAHGTF